MSIGQKIKQLRLDKQITQEELANYLGIAYQSVSKWETSITMPDITLLPSIALFFNITIDELFSMNYTEELNHINHKLWHEGDKSYEAVVYYDGKLNNIIKNTKSNDEKSEAYHTLIEFNHSFGSQYIRKAVSYNIQAINEMPFDKKLHDRLILMLNMSDKSRLVKYYEEFTKSHFEWDQGYYYLIRALLNESKFDEAKMYIDKIKNDSAEFKLTLADYLYMTGDKITAIKLYDEVKDDSDINYLYQVAERYNKYGMYNEAIVLFEKHSELNAPYLDSRYSLAFLYDKLHRYEKAIEMWEIILNSLRDDFNLIDGEEVNWPKREIEKLKLKVT